MGKRIFTLIAIALFAFGFNSNAYAGSDYLSAPERHGSQTYGQFYDYVTNNYPYKPVYDWEYPKQFRSDRDKVFRLLKELDQYRYDHPDAPIIPDAIEISVKGKEYVETIKDGDYLYYGGIKNNRPHGFGIIYDQGGEYLPDIYPVYAGNFNKGKPRGYGCKMNESGSIIWECSDSGFNGKKFEANGKGILYYNIANDEGTGRNQWRELYGTDTLQLIADSTDFEKDEIFNTNMSPALLMQYEHMILQPSVCYEGDMKNLEANGKGTRYYDVCQKLKGEVKGIYVEFPAPYGPKFTEGEFKNDSPSGKCKTYYFDGQLYYEGEYKNGKPHGKGTMYDTDGSVKHKGKFKNGDIA